MEFIEKYWEGIIAGLALITSAWSSWISHKTFKLQRTHNIKSNCTNSPSWSMGLRKYALCGPS